MPSAPPTPPLPPSASSGPDPEPRSEGFPWTETRDRLERLHAAHELAYEAETRSFVAASGPRLRLPFVQAAFASLESPADGLDTLGERLGLCVLVLLQAGATGLGLWRDDELLEHKTIKKYVVRGKGRAQPVHLESKGKSRYGSRLRLQNAVRQLEETNEKLLEWVARHGPFERIFYSCPVRTWPELFRVKPKPPFPQRGGPSGPHRIPIEVRVPDFAEVQRVWRSLTRGRETRS